jgi:hypothetical protein
MGIAGARFAATHAAFEIVNEFHVIIGKAALANSALPHKLASVFGPGPSGVDGDLRDVGLSRAKARLAQTRRIGPDALT